MSGLPSTSTWAMQQLAGFLASISSYPTVDRMVNAAAHRVAEAVDAEVCVVLAEGSIVAGVGFPQDDRPVDELLAAARHEVDVVDVPGVGKAHVFAVDVSLIAPGCLVVARSDEQLDPDERHLVRAMSQVLELAVQLRATAEREKQLRQATEEQASELREVNERLLDAMQVKRDLVAMASHELRTPIMTMLGFASVLSDGWRDFGDEERDEYLHVLHRHGQRLLSLVDDLLTVGQLESDRVQVRPSDVSLGLAVRDIVEGHGWQDLELDTGATGESGADLVSVDLGHLEQIVTNLVGNARKYGEPPLRVEVRTGAGDDGDRVELCVCDGGEGVPQEFEDSLFDRFTQASTGYHRHSSGVGLGLAIVSGLAERNAATVGYRREDDTTIFCVSFPVLRPVPGGTDARPGSDASV